MLRVYDSSVGIPKRDYKIIEIIDSEFILDRIDKKVVGEKLSIHVAEVFVWGLLGKLKIFYA